MQAYASSVLFVDISWARMTTYHICFTAFDHFEQERSLLPSGSVIGTSISDYENITRN